MQSDLRVVKTRRIIRNALFELMGEKPLAKIAISEICARAEINRKTFYRHYREVGDVITELENEILGEFAAIMRTGNKSVLDTGAAIRDISAVIERRREFFAGLMKLNPDLFSNGKIKATLCRMIYVSLKTAGAVEDETTLRAAAEFTVSGVLSLYAAWFDGGCTGDLAFLTEVSVKMTTKGLSAFVSEEKLSEMRLE
ncbi:MAG: TetR/AcrR family transcriptional regulator [Lachnospiraceae bacterium]|nr:TetR/AcrR family transcriptional regulator [Ruminococcus sp.]MCM1274888.1 TetR/AcrR family transcriptional regulator [Lachnospiraceae bacterium]